MKEQEMNMIDLIKYLWSKKKFIITAVFIITSISIVICLFLPKWYKSTAILLPTTGDDSALSLLSGGLSGMSFGRMFGNNTDQFKILAIIKSRTFKTQIVKKFNLVEKYKVDNIEEAVKELDDNIDAGIGDEMQIYIGMWDQDQEAIADMVNYAVYCLDSINISISTKKAREMKEFMKYRVEDVMDSLNRIQADLTKYMKSENVFSLENQVFVGLENAGQIQASIIAAEIELAITKSATNENNPNTEIIKEKLNILQNKYESLILAKEPNSILPKFENIPEIGIHLEEVKRKVEYYALMLQFLGPQYEKAKIDEKKELPTIEVLDYGVRPERKDKPKRALIVILVCFMSTIFSSAYVLIKGK
ncbi:MAG: hypothetical protein JXQ65_04940 [Candidatus Marinimicrobia bacterium]|nr:hypothetical protein [Candidatus Neomarinimicrobiota bacterium]